MSLTRDSHNLTVDGRPVRVVGSTGAIRATWRLFEGDQLLAEEEVLAGTRELVGTLSTGTRVVATVHQSALGSTKVVVIAHGETVAELDGFVA